MSQAEIVIIVSAGTEWGAIRELYPDVAYSSSPFGEWFFFKTDAGLRAVGAVFFQGGWGKISAAASTQYAIDRWKPVLIINLGTCGGFLGKIAPDTIVIAKRTLVYDIIDQMLNPDEALHFYTTDLDISWLSRPLYEREYRGVLVSADRDIISAEIPTLASKYGAVAADWESGAIAWVSARNGIDCVVVRGVTDLVGPEGGEAYGGNSHVFAQNARRMMRYLIGHLDDLLKQWFMKRKSGTINGVNK